MQSAQKIIGLNIKLARIKNGYSQAELADKLSVEQSYISRVESGKVAVSCERIYEIIHLLDCEASDIFPESKEVVTSFNKCMK